MFGSAADTEWATEDFTSEAPAVSAPASNGSNVSIKKTDDEQQLVYGEVYAPGFPDSQGDFMSAENIQRMAFEQLEHGKANTMCNGELVNGR